MWFLATKRLYPVTAPPFRWIINTGEQQAAVKFALEVWGVAFIHGLRKSVNVSKTYVPQVIEHY
jgi:hypothetical protein